MKSKVIESINLIIKKSKHVKINKLAIKKFVSGVDYNKIKHWTKYAHINLSKLNEEQRVAFLFVFNSLSFSYWGNPKWTIDKKINRGTFSMVLALQKAIDNNIPILSPFYLSTIKLNDLRKILKGNVEIPLLKERLEILHEIGETILIKYNGKFKNVLNEHKNTVELLNEIVNYFKSFDDKTIYVNKPVYFYKRAQLLISDLDYMLYLKLKDIDKLTACADYILPLVLRHYKILKYSKELQYKIDNNLELRKESIEELEIRANTIYAVELIKQELKKKNIIFTSMQINDYLWILGDRIPENENYHLTKTIWY